MDAAEFVGRPNPVLWYQTLARILSEQHGAEVALQRVTSRESGAVIWEREADGSAGKAI